MDHDLRTESKTSACATLAACLVNLRAGVTCSRNRVDSGASDGVLTMHARTLCPRAGQAVQGWLHPHESITARSMYEKVLLHETVGQDPLDRAALVETGTAALHEGTQCMQQHPP